MGWKRQGLVALLSFGLAVGCSVETAEHEGAEVAVISAALSVCEEMVPTNRYIDGIPAYAQCDASQNSAIYSNNGIDTATTQMGPDWVRTQYSGGYQCTELAHRYLVFKWNINWVPRGNAGTWCDTQPPASIGIVQTMEPVHGDIMVLPPGSCGASASTGHATVVDSVDSSGRLSVVEQNRANRGTYQPSCAGCFLHVVANDGTPPTGMAGSSAGAGAGAGAGGAAGAPQAGSMAPAPMQPSPTPTPTTPPASTPPAMPQPTAPATPTPAPTPVTTAPAAAGTNAAMAGSIAMPPSGFYPVPNRRDRASSGEAGCSVVHGATSAHGSTCLTALLALALATRRKRRRPR